MASESVLQRLDAEFDAPPETLRAVVELLEAGATPAFLVHYRRHEVGGLSEDRIRAIEERWHVLQELEERKEAILEQARAQGKDDEKLRELLETTLDQDLLDDVYQSFRPHRATPGKIAEDKGLGPLALAIEHRSLGDGTLQQAAAGYVDESKGMATPEAVLEGVLYILAERYARDARLRARIREELSRGILEASATAPDRKGAQRYREFFAFQQPVRKISAERMLALRRAEREGFVTVRLCLPEGRAREIFRKHFASDLSENSPLLAFLDLVFEHAYEKIVRPACEADIRRKIKEKADRETVRLFCRNLYSQLMAPPLGDRKAMAVRASARTVWLAVVDEAGAIALHRTIHLVDEPVPAGEGQPATAVPEDGEAESSPQSEDAPAQVSSPANATPPESERSPDQPATEEVTEVRATREEALELVCRIVAEQRPAGIAIPHGRRQGVARRLVEEMLSRLPEGERPLTVPVDEAASAIYATSPAGRKRLGAAEVGVRTAVSLARRLQDPLRELVDMDLRALGVGHQLTEVHQGLLARNVERTIGSCLAQVGVDLNTASFEALAHVPGLGKDLAHAILEHRRKIGGFRRREQLLEVEGLDETVYRLVAGFLRIRGGDEPLDATAIHPESYDLARRLAAELQRPVESLIGVRTPKFDRERWEAEAGGAAHLTDLLRALAEAHRDPRGRLEPLHNEGVRSVDDLRADMRLRGRVTNLTEFGAFVDLGVGQDGLVHISQIPPHRLRPPRLLRVGEVITVYVVSVEARGKRIGLSMHMPRHLAEGRRPTLGERMGHKGRKSRDEEPAAQSRGAQPPPEGRRGERRRPPKRAGAQERRAPRSERGDRAPRDRGGRAPRVITVESDRPVEERLGFKGEIRSLSALRNLLSGKMTESPDASKTSSEGASGPDSESRDPD